MLSLPGFALAGPAFALPPAQLQFPRDHGAHPDFRTEWWYITGHARAGEREFGFQVTFFRSRVDAAQGMTSRFAARQLVFAHAAVTDVSGRKLWHDQRIAREGFDVVAAAPGDTRVRLRDWSLERQAAGYHAQIPAGDFALDLRCAPTQPVLLQGNQGLSRKGPQPEQASYYYSRPQLAVAGALSLQGRRFEVAGKAWLDHEWSEELLASAGSGLGLDRHEPGRRQRPHGLSPAAPGWFGAMGRRLLSHVRRRLAHLQPWRSGVQRAAPLDQPAVAGDVPGRVDRAHARGFLHRPGSDRQPGAGQPAVHRRHLLGRPVGTV